MKTLMICAVLSFIILIFGFAFLVNTRNLAYNYELTKAICDKNVCRDYLIRCINRGVVHMAPISGFVVFSENWTDPRTDTGLCYY